MSTEQQRQQWQELAAAATPGDWQFGGYHDLDDYDVHVFDGDNVTYIAQSCYDIDAYFIAAARAAVPQLLADVDALQAERDALAAELAERTTVTEQISMALHVRDTQLTAAIAERDALAAELERVRAQLDAVPEPMLHKASTRPLWTDDTPTPGTR